MTNEPDCHSRMLLSGIQILAKVLYTNCSSFTICLNKVKTYFIYILASKRNGTLYIGVTNNLERRVSEHRSGVFAGFTRKYNVHVLVYYEVFDDIQAAIQREKQLKKWNRQWKIKLIEKHNPTWQDLYDDKGELRSLPK